MIYRYLFAFFMDVSVVLPVTVKAQDKLPRFQIHYVRDRETPSSIAENFNIKTKDFLMLNNFPEDVKLKPGQKVLIRVLKDGENPPIENAYRPQSDDATPVKREEQTTYKPSKPAEKPVVEEEKPKPVVRKETAAVSGGSRNVEIGPNGVKYERSTDGYHVVEKGQTFYHIAIMYGLTVDKLKKLNNMPDYAVKIGQRLKVAE